MLLCKFCGKECKNLSSLGNHQCRCKNNPNRKVQSIGLEGKKRLKERVENGSLKWDDARKKKHSITMKKAVLENPDSYTSLNVCGRVKVQEYNGEKFHGKWEIEVAKWLDKNNIKWQRKVNPFNYFWNNNWHLYFPDFYLPIQDVYIEVKGYETERDRCKWSVVKNLIVLKNKEINLIRENNFALEAHLV